MSKNVSKNFIVLLFSFGVVFSSASNAKTLNVVTSVAPITNIVKNIAGDRATVQGVVPDGVNSHTFEPAPSDAKRLRSADIIFMNGLHLELPTIALAEQVKRDATPIVQLGDRVIRKDDWKFDFSFPEASGNPNPHLWPNVALSMRYAELVRDALVNIDPEYKKTYYANTTAFLSKLSKLDAAIFDCVKSIPEKNRKLVTYHDSYAYFAPRYGMTVIGAVQPADFSEPTPREMGRIIKQLRKESVPAVFGSEVFESKVLKQIAKEANAVFIDELADDDLPGEVGDKNHTFIGMMANNMKVMAGALGGDASCADHVDVTNVSGH